MRPYNFMADAEKKLSELGFKHAPLQQFADSSDVDDRYITTGDAPGAYYILGHDLRGRPKDKQHFIQLLWWVRSAPHADAYIAALGWKIQEEITEQSVDQTGNPNNLRMWSVIISPPHEWIVQPDPVMITTRRKRRAA